VVDHDADLEREADTGSMDVEDRHAVALTTVGAADLVVVVGGQGLKGLHDTARIIDDLCRIGVPPDLILPVLNGAPRSPATRAQLTRALRELTSERTRDGRSVRPPCFVRHHRSLEGRHRSAARLPEQLSAGLAGVAADVLAGTPASRDEDRPVRIRPGELGAALDLMGDARDPGSTLTILGDVP
jgi:hypothetical protein